jgi:hypothetical protein
MNGPLVALEDGCGPSPFRRADVEKRQRWRLYLEKGIDKLKICPAAELSRDIRDRRKGVEQSSTAHRVSIGSKEGQKR